MLLLQYGRAWRGRPHRADPPMQDRSPLPNDTGRVIRFRPRGASPGRWRWLARPRRSDRAPVADLSKYERGTGEDDYRHRMKMNALAVAITVVLMGIGTWLAVTIAEVREVQDCFLQGRPNCAPIKVPPAER